MNNVFFDSATRASHDGTGARFCFYAAREFFFSAMTTARFGVLLLTVLVCCAARAQTPGSSKSNYPVLIKDSTERRAKAEREWRRMLDAYSVPQTPPDFYPITYTPRSLLGVSDGIKLLAETSPANPDPLVPREALRGFVDRWREMIGAEPGSLSLTGADQSGPAHRFTYKQANYAYPIAAPFGELVAVLSSDGKLTQLDDRLIPVVELPSRPTIDSEVAAKRLVGRVFTYTDLAGREQRSTVNGEAELNVKQLVIMPVEKADAIEVRLAWEIAVGSSLSWTVFIDAVTGEELKVVQNFQT
jgi:hypothetical protein